MSSCFSAVLPSAYRFCLMLYELLIQHIIFPFLLVRYILLFHINLARGKLGYASVAWNCPTNADSSGLECVRRKSYTLCCNRFVRNHNSCNHNYVRENRKFHALFVTRRYFEAFLQRTSIKVLLYALHF